MFLVPALNSSPKLEITRSRQHFCKEQFAPPVLSASQFGRFYEVGASRTINIHEPKLSQEITKTSHVGAKISPK